MYVYNYLHILRAARYVKNPPANNYAPYAQVRGYFVWCGGLESSESWVLYDSLLMTGTNDLFRQ